MAYVCPTIFFRGAPIDKRSFNVQTQMTVEAYRAMQKRYERDDSSMTAQGVEEMQYLWLNDPFDNMSL